MAVLVSDTRDHKRQRRTVRINKRLNTSKDITIINIYTLNDRPSRPEAKTELIEGRKRQFYNNTWGLQYPTHNNGWKNQTEEKETEDLTR